MTTTDSLINAILKTSRKEGWEVYISLKDPKRILLLRFVCSKCKTPWIVERKECYYCKAPYARVKVCRDCGWIGPENANKCEKCGGKMVKKCVVCGKEETGRKKGICTYNFLSKVWKQRV